MQAWPRAFHSDTSAMYLRAKSSLADSINRERFRHWGRLREAVVRKILYLEDLRVGYIFESRTFRITSEDIKRFANEFDPQPFHLNEADAERSFFGRLVGSGWHTAAITMRLLVESVPLAGGILGAGMDEVRWPEPVRPDDVLKLQSIVLDLRTLKSRERYGMVKFRGRTLNQHDVAVQIVVGNLLVERRPL